MVFFKYNKKGDLEFDELGKLLIGLVLLIVLIVIVTVVINGNLSDQTSSLKTVFTGLN